MKKKETVGFKHIVCALLALALLLTPSLALAASVPEQAAAEALSLESIPEQLAQTLELDELSPLAELNNADAEQLNSLTISNGDGTSTAYIFQGPIKYLDKETNSIKFIDNKLKESSKSAGFLENYAYENTSNDIKVYLPKKIKKGVDIEYENISVNMRPEIINNEKGILKEYTFAGENMEVMEYPDAFGEGCHLQYQPLNRGLKENILVEEYNGTNTFSFELKLKKGYAEISEDNRIIYIKDEQGETVFILNQPYARDSFTGIDANLSHRTFDDYYILEQTGNKTYRVTMVIDEDFLSSAETVYPVLIDPTFDISSGSILDMSALSSGSTAYGPQSEFLVVGDLSLSPWVTSITYAKNNFMWYYRFIRPDNISSMYHKAYVTSLTNVGNINVFNSNKQMTMGDSLNYTKILEQKGDYVSSAYVSGTGWIELDITSLGRTWLKNETKEIGGRTQDFGYMLDFGGPGMIMLGSAEHATHSGYITFTFTEDNDIADGEYFIRNKLTGKYMQADGDNLVRTGNGTGSNNQIWQITGGASGIYKICNKASGLYMGPPTTLQFGVGTMPVVKAAAHNWRILRNGNNTYRLFEYNSIYSLEVENGGAQTAVLADGYAGYPKSQWEFVPAAGQVAVKWPNGTYIQRVKTSGSTVYKNEAGVALEVRDSREIIIEPIIVTNINASGNDWHKTVDAPYTYTITGSSKIGVSQSGNTLTITGKALGEARITITSGDAQTTVPVVVADRVLDVPLERQVWSQTCWAACGSMVIKGMIPSFNNPLQLADDAHNNDENYPAYNDTQYDIIEEVKGSRIRNDDTTNRPDSMGNVAAALETISGNVMSGTTVAAINFSQELLRQKLDAGSPVVYNSSRFDADNERNGGHFRVIYGYYWYSDPYSNTVKCVYLVHDPWDPCKKYNSEGSAIGNNFHLDIWRRSWENIMNEKAVGISGLDRPETHNYTYATNEFIYFVLGG